MKTRQRIFRITIIAAFIVLSMLSEIAQPTKAQSGWSITYDFTTGQHEWTGLNTAGASPAANYVATQGWYSVQCNSAGLFKCLYIVLDWPIGSGDVTQVDVTFSITNNLGIGMADFIRAKDGLAFTGAQVCTLDGDSGLADGASLPLATRNYPVSCPGARSWLIASATQDSGGQVFIQSVTFSGTGDPPTGGQAGDAPPPNVPAPPLAGLPDCPLLGANTATFSNLPGAWALSGSATNPEGTTRGLYLQNGSAKLTMNLSPNRTYTIEIKARNGSGNQNGFRVGLGRQSYNPIPIDPGGSIDIKLGPANYNAGAPDDSIYETSPEETPAGYFTLSFRRNGLLDGQTGDYVVIDYVCVRDAGVEGAIGQANTDDTSFLGQATPQECKTEPNKPQTEPYSATGNQLTDMYANFKGLISDWGSYMSQLMARLTSCILKPGLKGVWQWIQGVLNFIMRARDWIDIFFKNFGDYLGLAAKWLAGFIVNVISVLLNLIAQLLNNLGLSRIVNDVLHFLNAILPKGLASIPEIVGTVWDAFSNFVNFVATVIVGFIQGVFNLIGMLFGVTRAIIDADPIPLPIPGFCDTTANSIPENCIWVFTVDYTILDPNSPIGAFIPLLKGGAGIGLIWWAIHAIRGSAMEQQTSEA